MQAFCNLSKEEQEQVIEQCKKNCCFSNKYLEGYISPFGEMLSVPSGIVRYRLNFRTMSGGWKVQYKGLNYLASDRDHSHDYHRALEAAIEYFRQHNELPLVKTGTRIHRVPAITKKLQILGVGIYDDRAIAYIHGERIQYQITPRETQATIEALKNWRIQKENQLLDQARFTH